MECNGRKIVLIFFFFCNSNNNKKWHYQIKVNTLHSEHIRLTLKVNVSANLQMLDCCQFEGENAFQRSDRLKWSCHILSPCMEIRVCMMSDRQTDRQVDWNSAAGSLWCWWFGRGNVHLWAVVRLLWIYVYMLILPIESDVHVCNIFRCTSPVSDVPYHFLIISRFQAKSHPMCLPRFLLTSRGEKKVCL